MVVQPSPQIQRSGRGRRARGVLTQPAPIPMASEELAPVVMNVSPHNESVLPENPEALYCPLCTLIVADDTRGLCCDHCSTWYHANCLFISEEEYMAMSNSPDDWYCDRCSNIKRNKIKWGPYEGEEDISREIKKAYLEITKWKKNMFTLPRGKSGTEFIKELTRLIYLFAEKTKWEKIAMLLVHIFIPLMLQKPSQKSKAKDHVKYLSSRLEKWKDGDLAKLLAECKEIQKRLLKRKA